MNCWEFYYGAQRWEFLNQTTDTFDINVVLQRLRRSYNWSEHIFLSLTMQPKLAVKLIA